MSLVTVLLRRTALPAGMGCMVACSTTANTPGSGTNDGDAGKAGGIVSIAGAAGLAGTGGSGGGSNPFGGDKASAGASNPSAGAPNASGGAPNASGGALNASGGAVSNTVGGATELPGGLCGDAVVNAAGEECDYGRDNSDVGACTAQCKNATCGDGLVQSGKEACDTKGAAANCDPDCTLPACGDGVVNAAAGEACDSGADNGKPNQCSPDCLFVCEGACPIRVDPALATAGDGTAWASAYTSLSTAIDTQYDRGGGQVWVKLADIAGPITMRRGVMIYGGFTGAESLLAKRPVKQYTTLTGGMSVVTGASNSRIDGFAITKGNANRTSGTPHIDGGGMFNSSITSLVVANCRFQSNQALGHGGAIYNTNSSVRIEDVTFLENTAATGGGVYNSGSDGVVIIRSRFEKNTAATAGGGLYNENADTSVADSVFVSNTATTSGQAQGGGAYNSSCSPTFTNVLFYQNTAFTGGAMLSTATAMGGANIINCLFAANVNSNTAGAGGLTDADAAGSKVIGTTFAFNTGPGGLNITGTTTTTCANCVIVTKSSAGKNHNLATAQLITSCVMLLGVMGAPANPFVDPQSDADGDGIPEYLLTQLDSNACVNSGTDATSTSAGIAWSSSTTSSSGCLDKSPVDAGRHYPSTNTQACN